MNDEAGWLIEMKFGDGLLWWSGEFDRAGDDYQRARLIARMVNDAGKAVRFARREDAQRVLDGMFSARPCPIFGNAPTLYSVQEHMWPAPSQPEQQAPWREMIEDTKDVFDFNGAETPQIVRDVIEYASSWLQVAEDKAAQLVALTGDEKSALDRALLRSVKIVDEAAQPVAQGPRVCWLVEEFSDTGNSTGRYMQDQNDLTITTDAQQARRFRRSRTATFRATDMREKWGTAWRPVSHVFRAAQPQQAIDCTDPHCPCRDGDTCHYKDGPDGTKAWATQPQQAAPSRSQRMRDAGFTPRDNRLECDECGQKVMAQFMPIHKCAQQAAQPQQAAPP